MLYTHNDTGNVWTHAIAAVLFASLALMSDATDILRLVFLVTFCAMACASSAYHMLRYTGHRAFEVTYGCDLGGTLATIVATTNWLVALAFRCHPRARAVYAAAHNCAALPLALALPWLTHGAARGEDRWHLVGPLFLALVLSGTAPLVHASVLSEADMLAISFVAAMMCMYGVGAAVLFTKWPESSQSMSGRFDLWGNSHQIWHLCVVAGGLLGYAAGCIVAQHNVRHACPTA